MADKKAVKAKRRVKNPETFRERALKAGETAGKPKAKGRIWLWITRTSGFIFRPVGRLLKAIFTSPPFRLLGRLLRPVGKILAKVLFLNGLRRSWQELRMVTWPNWTQSRKLTVAVLVFAVIFGATIAAVDFVVEKAFKQILLK